MKPPGVGVRWAAFQDVPGHTPLTDDEFDWHFTDEATEIRREVAWSSGWSDRMVYDSQCSRVYLEELRAMSHAGKTGD
jgi:hypothetical protein